MSSNGGRVITDGMDGTMDAKNTGSVESDSMNPSKPPKTSTIPQQGQGPDARQRRLSHILYWNFFVNLALMCFDAAMFLLAGAAVSNLRAETGPFWSGRFNLWVSDFALLAIGTVLWVWCLYQGGMYHRHVMGDGHQINRKLVFGAIRSGLLLCAAVFILGIHVTLTTLVLIMVAAFAMTLVERLLSRVYIMRTIRRGNYSYATVLVGSPAGMARTLRFLENCQQLNYHAVALCPIRLNQETGLIEADHDMHMLQHLVLDRWPDLKVIEYKDRGLGEDFVANQIQTVMVADVLRRFSDNFNVFSMRMESMDLEVALATSAADVSGHEIQVRSFHGTTVMTIRLPQFSPARKLMKRVFDIIVSAIAIVLSSPFMLGVAIAIKLDDHGPVLYKQERIGLYGKPFKIYKFRSMRVDADKMDAEVAAAAGQELGARFKVKNDPRITKVGHFIRKTSLDELPQFFNSFLGSMSVVGPRPQRQYEVDEYNQVYATRLLVKPGITGPWQVSGRNDLSEEESQQLDVSYVQNWSVLGDISYVFRTVGVMLNPKGAY